MVRNVLSASIVSWARDHRNYGDTHPYENGFVILVRSARCDCFSSES